LSTKKAQKVILISIRIYSLTIIVENEYNLWLKDGTIEVQSQPSLQTEFVLSRVRSARSIYEGNIRFVFRPSPRSLFSIIINHCRRHEQLQNLPYERISPESLVQTAGHSSG
jgi:hypothetical protein